MKNKEDFVQTFRKNVVTALMNSTEKMEYAEEKKKLQKAMAELIQEQAQQNGDETAFAECCQTIAAQMEVLGMKQIKEASKIEEGSKMDAINGFLGTTDCVLTEYDDKLVYLCGQYYKDRSSIQIWNHSRGIFVPRG